MAGIDPKALPQPLGPGMRHDHMPETAKPWVNLWSAGQGIDLITDIPTVAELVSRLRRKLEPLDCIKTLRNAGYAFAGARV
jgi:nitronate monooxygenase